MQILIFYPIMDKHHLIQHIIENNPEIITLIQNAGGIRQKGPKQQIRRVYY